MTMHDSYELETGLKQAFDMTIASASFEYDSNYNNGQTLCLVLKGVDSDGDPERLLFPCSPGWAPGDGGARAEREDGAQNRTFNQTSGVGGLILAALQLGAPLRERGPATSASVWPGLSFRFERKTLHEDNPQFKTTRALPTAFLGVGNASTQAPAQAPTAAPAQPAATQAPAAPPNGAAALDALTTAKLKNLAKQCDTHDAFIEQGLALAESNPAVEQVLADVSWYEAARA